MFTTTIVDLTSSDLSWSSSPPLCQNSLFRLNLLDKLRISLKSFKFSTDPQEMEWWGLEWHNNNAGARRSWSWWRSWWQWWRWWQETGYYPYCDDDNPTTRIPNVSLYTSVHVTKNAHGDISGTKRGIIDLLVSKRLEKNKLRKNFRDHFLIFLFFLILFILNGALG